jgi:hypothetical protein
MQESLEVLAGKFYDAKKAENAAKEARIAIEEQIAEQIETAVNGSKTVDAGNGLKITVKRAMRYKADVDAIRSGDVVSEDLMPLKMTPPVPATYVFDPKRYEALVAENPTAAASLAKFVTVTPAKVAVSIKLA